LFNFNFNHSFNQTYIFPNQPQLKIFFIKQFFLNHHHNRYRSTKHTLFGSVVVVAFQIVFYAEIHVNDFFYFLKIIFNISISKRSKKYKPHSILIKKNLNLVKHKFNRRDKHAFNILLENSRGGTVYFPTSLDYTVSKM
jgi:hypothetical protein